MYIHLCTVHTYSHETTDRSTYIRFLFRHVHTYISKVCTTLPTAALRFHEGKPRILIFSLPQKRRCFLTDLDETRTSGFIPTHIHSHRHAGMRHDLHYVQENTFINGFVNIRSTRIHNKKWTTGNLNLSPNKASCHPSRKFVSFSMGFAEGHTPNGQAPSYDRVWGFSWKTCLHGIVITCKWKVCTIIHTSSTYIRTYIYIHDTTTQSQHYIDNRVTTYLANYMKPTYIKCVKQVWWHTHIGAGARKRVYTNGSGHKMNKCSNTSMESDKKKLIHKSLDTSYVVIHKYTHTYIDMQYRHITDCTYDNYVHTVRTHISLTAALHRACLIGTRFANPLLLQSNNSLRSEVAFSLNDVEGFAKALQRCTDKSTSWKHCKWCDTPFHDSLGVQTLTRWASDCEPAKTTEFTLTTTKNTRMRPIHTYVTLPEFTHDCVKTYVLDCKMHQQTEKSSRKDADKCTRKHVQYLNLSYVHG